MATRYKGTFVGGGNVTDTTTGGLYHVDLNGPIKATATINSNNTVTGTETFTLTETATVLADPNHFGLTNESYTATVTSPIQFTIGGAPFTTEFTYGGLTAKVTGQYVSAETLLSVTMTITSPQLIGSINGSYALVKDNVAPVVSVHDLFPAKGTKLLSASGLFTASDADGDPIVKYQFFDSTAEAASGHFVLNGQAQPVNQSIDVSAAQLSTTTFQLGTVGDQLSVRASDGTDWSDWKAFSVAAPNNHAPVVNAAAGSVLRNQAVAATSLFTVSDADADPVTQYEFWDSGTAAASGHFTVSGVTQAADQSILVTAANLSQVSYVGGVAAGSETVWLRAYDGTDWGAWKSWTMTSRNLAPVVTARDTGARRNQALPGSTLFSVTDADGDAITQYEFWDGGAAVNTGHFSINGVTQAANQSIPFSAADLAQVSYVGGDGPGAETVWVRANDGIDWGQWKNWTMTTSGSGPVASAANRSVHAGQAVAVSSLFTASDADGDAITRYEFWDSGAAAGSGHFSVNATAQSAAQAIPVAAANLAQVTYVAGSAAASETVWVRADDGTGFGAWKSWVMSTTNTAPVVIAGNAAVARNQSVSAGSLFSVSDADGDAITQYEFWDSGAAAGTGHFTIGGMVQPAGQSIPVTAGNLSQVSYVGGDVPGAETVWVRANDGSDWSAWKSWTMTSQGSAPVATAGKRSVHVGQSVAASSLFTASDADNDAMTGYELWDSGSASGSGHFSINGASQPANQGIPVAAADLSQVSYVGGSTAGAETLWVRADDGTGFGAWVSWQMSTGNTAPVVNANDGSVARNQAVPTTSLFSVSDAEGDVMTQFEFWDSGNADDSGHFTVNGTAQPPNQSIPVAAANLLQVSYVGGSATGSETVWARANDGTDWSAWKNWSMTTLAAA